MEGLRAKIAELRSRKSEDSEETQDEKKKGEDEEGTGIEWGEDVKDEDVVWNVARFRDWGGHEEWTTEQMGEIADGTPFLKYTVMRVSNAILLLSSSLLLANFAQTS